MSNHSLVYVTRVNNKLSIVRSKPRQIPRLILVNGIEREQHDILKAGANATISAKLGDLSQTLQAEIRDLGKALRQRANGAQCEYCSKGISTEPGGFERRVADTRPEDYGWRFVDTRPGDFERRVADTRPGDYGRRFADTRPEETEQRFGDTRPGDFERRLMDKLESLSIHQSFGKNRDRTTSNTEAGTSTERNAKCDCGRQDDH
jgi:hypothetical protein